MSQRPLNVQLEYLQWNKYDYFSKIVVVAKRLVLYTKCRTKEI